MLSILKRAFRPLDTSEFDAAMTKATCETQQVRVRTRAIRIGVSCAEPLAVAQGLTKGAGSMFGRLYQSTVNAPLPPGMLGLLDKL